MVLTSSLVFTVMQTPQHLVNSRLVDRLFCSYCAKLPASQEEVSSYKVPSSTEYFNHLNISISYTYSDSYTIYALPALLVPMVKKAVDCIAGNLYAQCNLFY